MKQQNRRLTASIFLAAAVLLFSSAAFGADGNAKSEKEVRDVEDQINLATRTSDASKLEKLLTADFVNILPSGEFQTRSEFLEDLKNVKFHEYKVEDVKVRVYEGAAVVTSRAT